MDRYRVLIAYDVDYEGPNGREGWAYFRRAKAIQKYAPEDFKVTIASAKKMPHVDLRAFDILFSLDYQAAPAWKHDTKAAKCIHVVSHNKDHYSRQREWERTLQTADWVIVNNELRYRADGIKPRTCCISNGVDLDIFKPLVPINERPHKCLWTGGTGPAKLKFYRECIECLIDPLMERDFTTSFRPITSIDPSQCFDTAQMVEWYSSGSYILCASGSEGTPNGLLEGMACGCIPVMTRVGNVPEILVSGENGLIVEAPQWRLFMEAIEYAREHRERLSAAALESIRSWSYGPPGYRANCFYALFRALIQRKPIAPFSYKDLNPEEL